MMRCKKDARRIVQIAPRAASLMQGLRSKCRPTAVSLHSRDHGDGSVPVHRSPDDIGLMSVPKPEAALYYLRPRYGIATN